MRNILKELRPEKLRNLVLLLLIFMVLLGFSSVIDNYLNARLFNRISTSVAIFAVLAVGQTLVVLTRNIDLSVGSIVGFTAYIVGQQLSQQEYGAGRARRPAGAPLSPAAFRPGRPAHCRREHRRHGQCNLAG